MKKPDLPTLLWAAVFVVVVIFIYHFVSGRMK